VRAVCITRYLGVAGVLEGHGEGAGAQRVLVVVTVDVRAGELVVRRVPALIGGGVRSG
jgi:hypothetical protein